MMDQPVIAKLLISYLVAAGASTQNPFIKGHGQSGVTIQSVLTTTQHWYPTGRPVSAISTPFTCADGSGSLNRTLVCNGRIDCMDGSDENSQLCSGTSCMNTFPCLNGKCIRLAWHCDGFNDCGDNSDEDPSICHWSESSQVVTCANGQVLKGENILCNGVYNCMDKSDEFNCSKCPGQLMCDKGYRCVKPGAICDRIQDCFDGADESCLIPDNQRCNVGNFICPTGMCVTKDKIMSGNRCWGFQVVTREENLKYCNLPNVLCDNATKCIPPQYRCDGKQDCQDGSDEMSPNKNIISDPSFKCANGYCVPYLAICDGINDCGNSSDELPINEQCLSFSAVNCPAVHNISSFYWQCNNSLCIPSYQVDNARNNCGDFSDEKNSSLFYFTCTNGKKVLRSFLCDGRDNCGDNSDENYWSCTVNTPRPTCQQYTCPSGKCIHYTDVCDRYNDCGDNSDEQSCVLTTSRPICLEHTCPSGKCIRYTYVCDGYNDCGDNSDERSCPLTTRKPICRGHTCPSGKCILTIEVCNGNRDCEDDSDESDCYISVLAAVLGVPVIVLISVGVYCWIKRRRMQQTARTTAVPQTRQTRTTRPTTGTTAVPQTRQTRTTRPTTGTTAVPQARQTRTTRPTARTTAVPQTRQTRTTRPTARTTAVPQARQTRTTMPTTGTTAVPQTMQTTSLTSRTQAANITVSTINVQCDLPPSYDQVIRLPIRTVASDLPPPYDQVIRSSAPSLGAVNSAFVISD